MYAVISAGNLIYGPDDWNPSVFQKCLGNVSVSLPASPPDNPIEINDILIVQVSEVKPDYDAATQMLVAGPLVVSGDTASITYTVEPIPAPPPPTSGQIFAAAVNAGVQVTSTATGSLSDTYAITPDAVMNINSVIASIAAGKGLPGGGETFEYFGKSGPHNFSVTDFGNLATVIRDYVYNLQVALLTAEGGGAPSWPSAVLTIP